MGYYRAGFEVVGVDIKPQPHYPFEFHQADALTYPLDGFDAYHASPPCQRWAGLQDATMHNTGVDVKSKHPDYISTIRQLLIATSKPYVIENVVKSPLKATVILCGASLGLKGLERHRKFETNFLLSLFRIEVSKQVAAQHLSSRYLCL